MFFRIPRERVILKIPFLTSLLGHGIAAKFWSGLDRPQASEPCESRKPQEPTICRSQKSSSIFPSFDYRFAIGLYLFHRLFRLTFFSRCHWFCFLMDYLTRVHSHGSLARVSFSLIAKLRHVASNISFRKSKDVLEIIKARKTNKWPGIKIILQTKDVELLLLVVLRET